MLSWHAFSTVGWVTSLIAERRLNKGRNRPAFLGSRMSARGNPYNFTGHVKAMKIGFPESSLRRKNIRPGPRIKYGAGFDPGPKSRVFLGAADAGFQSLPRTSMRGQARNDVLETLERLFS